MDTRVRNNYRPNSPTRTQTMYQGDLYTLDNVYGTHIGDYQSVTSERSGVFVPGILRLNECEIFKQTAVCTTGSIKWWNTPSLWLTVNGAYLGSILDTERPIGSWNQNLADLSLVKAYDKAKQATAELGVILGELKETLHLLKNPLASVTKLLRGIPKLSIGRTATDLSNSWLAYRYGIRPLIMDIQGIIQAYESNWTRCHNALLRARATVQTKSSSGSVINGRPIPGGTVTVRGRRNIENKCTSVVYYKWLQTGAFTDFKSVGGVTFGDIPQIAWELVGYSFVVDWFIKVGQWLQAIKPSANFQLAGSCTSQVITTTEVWEPSNAVCSYPTWPLSQFSPSVTTYTEKRLIRRINQSLPVLPPVDFDYKGLTHVIDSLALLWGRTPRHWRSK